jgi:hypothetical protein
MGQFLVKGQDRLQTPPQGVAFVPPPKPPIPGRAGDADDGGALWWDHDDPGQAGAAGENGDPGVNGAPGDTGGDVPAGTTVLINKEIDGVYQVLIHGGMGQPAGDAGRGGDGGRGQDGGHSDDEQPAGAGGRGGRGGNGGFGNKGGDGGNIYNIDIMIGSGVGLSQVAIVYEQGLGGAGGKGGEPGNGGPGGTGGDGSPGMNGDAGTNPGFGQHGANGIVSTATVLGG